MCASTVLITRFDYRSSEWMGPFWPDIADEFLNYLDDLQFRGDGERDGRVFRVHGYVYVPDPYSRSRNKERR